MPILDTLASLCLKSEKLTTKDDKDSLLEKLQESPESIMSDDNIRFHRTLEKIIRMKTRVIRDGFTSFAEA